MLAEREVTIARQQEAIRELSTPTLQFRERLLILPIIGLLDSHRAKQLTENLLSAVRDKRALVVVMDVADVPTVDSRVANHLIQTVSAVRLMGAQVIVTGLSAEVAQSLVTLGGLGLSQVYGFAQQSGGAVEVTGSETPGAASSETAGAAGIETPGATLRLFLPALARQRTVLVVDDDIGVAKVAAAELRECGFNVKVAHRGHAAMQALRDDEAIDLLFTDIVMPDGMDGLALAGAARRLRPRLPILLATGFSATAAEQDAGAVEFPILSKPYRGRRTQAGDPLGFRASGDGANA